MALIHDTRPKETKASSPVNNAKKAPIDRAVTDFLNDTLVSYDKSVLTLYNGNPVLFTPDFSVPDGIAFSCGITVGEVRKGRVLPHQQFFRGMGRQFKRKIELQPDSEALARYLHGEEIAAECENGWAAVTVHGCPLGGAKAVSGVAKNHYPKGLRSKN